MKRQIIMICLFTFLTGCYSSGVLTKKDYIQMSDEEIRKVLFQYTPIGSKDDYVKKVMREKFNCRPEHFYVYRKDSVIKETRIFIGKIEINDYTLKATLGSYGEARYLFLARNLVVAVWLFTKEGILKDIHIEHYTDGV